MNHKRKRPKNARGGCLMCKPWKMNGFCRYGHYGEDKQKHSDTLRIKAADHEMAR